LGTDHQSVQSVAGEISCNKTTLLRCISTQTFWNRQAQPSYYYFVKPKEHPLNSHDVNLVYNVGYSDNLNSK